MTRPHTKTHTSTLRNPLDKELFEQCFPMYVNVFLVGGLFFLVYKTGTINYISLTALNLRSGARLIEGIKPYLFPYKARNIIISNVHGDNKFNFADFIKTILPALFYIYAKNEYIRPIEWIIRIIKERGRCLCHTLPYQRYIHLIIRCLVSYIVELINRILSKDGSDRNSSTATIVEGNNKIDLSKNRITYGSYAEVWTGTDNTMKTR